ncbi:hypothetical protein [Kitasatospora sp. NPDC088134]|uniref:hypothetical protein n=1 Tax=Kitasatospora sp. NPDC088134 TaxID=3364071 RepID=UPI0038276E2A
MNIDFSADPLFSWYVVLLLISGIAMVGIGAMNNSGLSGGWRAFNAIAGVGFAGYAIYLGFIFEGGSYIIFFKAFILPVIMIVNFFRSLANRSKATTTPAYPPAPAFQAPAQQPYPGQAPQQQPYPGQAAQPQVQPYGAAPAAPADQQPQAPQAG